METEFHVDCNTDSDNLSSHLHLPCLVKSHQYFDSLSNHAQTNVIEPIMIAPEPGFLNEPWNIHSFGNPTVTDSCDDLNMCLPNEVSSLNIQPLVIEPLSEDSDQEDGETVPGETCAQSKGPSRQLYRCVKCKQKFKSPGHLLKHKELYCRKKRPQDAIVTLPQFTCLKCNYRSNGRIPLTTCILHTKIHDKLKYSCQDCDVRFKWWNSVLRHWKDYHRASEETCVEPETQFNVQEGSTLSRSDEMQQNFTSDSNEQYFCANCTMMFKTVQLFCSHLRACWLRCSCGTVSETIRSSLRHHIERRNNCKMNTWFLKGLERVEPWYIACPACSYSVDNEELLVKHLVQSNWHEGVHTANPTYQRKFAYMCPICLEYIFKSPVESQVLELVLNHIKMYHSPTAKCHFCDTSHELFALTTHIEKDHKDMPSRTCLYCGRIFLSVQSALSHMHHHDRCKIRCTKCLWAFESMSILRQHKLTKHREPNPALMCHDCGFETQYMSEKVEHQKQHVWLKEKCTECPMRFLTDSLQKQHIDQHNEMASDQSVVLVMPDVTKNLTRPRYNLEFAVRNNHQRNTIPQLQFDKIQEDMRKMRTFPIGSWKCFLCTATYKSDQMLIFHLGNQHGNCHMSLCNGKTTTFAYSDGFSLLIKCIGCVTCATKEGTKHNRIFPSIKSFEEHCCSYPAVIHDEITCQIPACPHVAQDEVQYYGHLARCHKDTVTLLVYRDTLSILYYDGPRKIQLGRRYSCIFCKRIFFSREALHNHLIKYKVAGKSYQQGLDNFDMLFTQQPLSDELMTLLSESPIVSKISSSFNAVKHKNRRTVSPIKFCSNQVSITTGHLSKGRKTLIQNHNSDSLEELGTCSECEQLLQARIPPDICFAQYQPLVTLYRDDLQKYMMNYALNSGQPIPKWYRQHFATAYTTKASRVRTNGFIKPSFIRMLKRKTQRKRHKNTTKVGIAESTSQNSAIWSKYCRKCYRLFEVLVLQADCVHKKYVIVSLINADAQTLNHTSNSELNEVRDETANCDTSDEMDQSASQSEPSSSIMID